jgi:hypothetical protein
VPTHTHAEHTHAPFPADPHRLVQNPWLLQVVALRPAWVGVILLSGEFGPNCVWAQLHELCSSVQFITVRRWSKLL